MVKSKILNTAIETNECIVITESNVGDKSKSQFLSPTSTGKSSDPLKFKTPSITNLAGSIFLITFLIKYSNIMGFKFDSNKKT